MVAYDSCNCGHFADMSTHVWSKNDCDVIDTDNGEQSFLLLSSSTAVFVNGMNWTISSDNPIPGEESPILLDVDVDFEDYSRNVSGNDLWQVSLFGSQSPEGNLW